MKYSIAFDCHRKLYRVYLGGLTKWFETEKEAKDFVKEELGL